MSESWDHKVPCAPSVAFYLLTGLNLILFLLFESICLEGISQSSSNRILFRFSLTFVVISIKDNGIVLMHQSKKIYVINITGLTTQLKFQALGYI